MADAAAKGPELGEVLDAIRKAGATHGTLLDRVADLMCERDRLRAELAAAKASPATTPVPESGRAADPSADKVPPRGYFWEDVPVRVASFPFAIRPDGPPPTPTFADEFAVLARKHFRDLFELRVDWNTGGRVRVRAFTASHAASEAADGTKVGVKSHRRRVKEVLGDDEPDDGCEAAG